MSDAVRKANDLAEILGREVVCVEVKDMGFSVKSSRGAPSKELDTLPSQPVNEMRIEGED